MKKLLMVLCMCLCVVGFGSTGFSLDKGEKVITLNPDGKKPSKFPHFQHQGVMSCGSCHKDLDV